MKTVLAIWISHALEPYPVGHGQSETAMEAKSEDFKKFHLVLESSCRNFIVKVNFASQDAKSSLNGQCFSKKRNAIKSTSTERHLVRESFFVDFFSICITHGVYSLPSEEIWRFWGPRRWQVKTSWVYLISEREIQHEELIAILNFLIFLWMLRGLTDRRVWHFYRSAEFVFFLSPRLLERWRERTAGFRGTLLFCDNQACYGKREWAKRANPCAPI